MFELGEELFDRIEVGTVGRQEEKVGACLPDGASCLLALVAAEVVEDDDVAPGEGRDENPLDVEGEDRAVDDPRCIDAIGPERCDESERFPTAMRYASWKALSPRRPTS